MYILYTNNQPIVWSPETFLTHQYGCDFVHSHQFDHFISVAPMNYQFWLPKLYLYPVYILKTPFSTPPPSTPFPKTCYCFHSSYWSCTSHCVTIHHTILTFSFLGQNFVHPNKLIHNDIVGCFFLTRYISLSIFYDLCLGKQNTCDNIMSYSIIKVWNIYYILLRIKSD